MDIVIVHFQNRSSSLLTMFILAVLLLPLISFTGSSDASYHTERNQFTIDERAMYIGSGLNLTDGELVVNNVLMVAKTQEFSQGFNEPATFPPARHFFQARDDIDNSQVFKFIQRMPKGGALHLHILALASTEYLVSNLTYRDNLYSCVAEDGSFLLHFFLEPDSRCDWVLLGKMRQLSDNVKAFDAGLARHLSMFEHDPRVQYLEEDSAWNALESVFATVTGLLTYRPVFEDYITQFLTEFLEDNIMYLEIRTSLAQVYELNGTVWSSLDTAKLCKRTMDKFIQKHPAMLPGKIIYAPDRKGAIISIRNHLKTYRALKAALPDFVVGFDLVGQEDKGNRLSDYIEPLIEAKDEIKYFFHAGETCWHGLTDLNLIDAILLNSTRIGHGFALIKHPLVLKLIKERDIAIEVNPISNQVLMMVSDLRNHPSGALLADGYPVVVSSDAPSFWGALPLSHDIYAALMGLGGLDTDLRLLKQLAINSIKYSAMNEDEKLIAAQHWNYQWEMFLHTIVHTKNISKKSDTNTTVSSKSQASKDLEHEDL